MAPQKKAIQQKYYQVVNDGILGSLINDREAAPHEIKTLVPGVYSSADLKSANIDIAWHLKIGTIIELDYVPVGEATSE